MRVFLVFSALIVIALARPEAGYSYNRPSSGGLLVSTGNIPLQNHGISSGGLLIGGGGLSQGSYSQGGGSSGGLLIQTGGLQAAPAPQYNIPAPNYNIGTLGGGSTGGGLLVNTGPSLPISQPLPQPLPAPQPTFVQQPPLIQKHIYVHVPPPEQEEVHQQRIIGQSVQPVKHYKIIFIKAPSPPAPTQQQIIQAQQQNLEKTLIYVLSKKPDEIGDITLQSNVAPIQPSKPEVYFIRYKSNKQSTGGGNIALNTIGSSGGSINLGSTGGGFIHGGSVSDGGLSLGSLGTSTIGGSGLTTSYGPPNRSGPYKRSDNKQKKE